VASSSLWKPKSAPRKSRWTMLGFDRERGLGTLRDDLRWARYTEGMAEILVECYAGFRADERPLRFTLRGRVFEVAEVEDRWYSPGAIYFRIRADDGNFYIVRHDEGRDAWTLEGFRASGSSGTPPDPAERGASNGPHGAS
jgi:hypothetical protein